MTTKEGSTKFVNIVTPGAGVLCRGGGWDDKMGRVKIMYNLDYVHVDCCCINIL